MITDKNKEEIKSNIDIILSWLFSKSYEEHDKNECYEKLVDIKTKYSTLILKKMCMKVMLMV